jgi:hypothetical protein
MPPDVALVVCLFGKTFAIWFAILLLLRSAPQFDSQFEENCYCSALLRNLIRNFSGIDLL